MNTTTEFNHLADALKAAVVPKSFRSLKGLSAAKTLCTFIDHSLQSEKLIMTGNRENALIDMSVQLRGAAMDNQALGASNPYVCALSKFADAVDAAIAAIHQDQAKAEAARIAQARQTALESAAKERESRLKEPMVDVPGAWANAKSLVTKENLRSLSRFKAASAAVESIDSLINQYPALIAGGEGEKEALEGFLDGLWKLPKISNDPGMGADLAAHDVFQAISKAAMDRLAQIQYEIDSRPENVMRSWNLPTAR